MGRARRFPPFAATLLVLGAHLLSAEELKPFHSRFMEERILAGYEDKVEEGHVLLAQYLRDNSPEEVIRQVEALYGQDVLGAAQEMEYINQAGYRRMQLAAPGIEERQPYRDATWTLGRRAGELREQAIEAKATR
jgi:hypothetical protein